MQHIGQLEGRIWLIGGTEESKKLVAAIAEFHLPCTVTVTTPTARSLYPTAPKLRVQVGCLHLSQLDSFIEQEGIIAILDASHPYAVEISQAAIAVALKKQIPYLRYERPSVEVASDSAKVIHLDSFDTLLAGDYLQEQRVLLTLGYKPLSLFRSWQERSTLYARILPSVTALEAALAADFTPERIFAMRPPIPYELEKALWQHWQISLVVTKASGTAGGEDIKRRVAAELGIPLVIITRPDVKYPQQTSNLSVALEFCQRYLQSS